MLFCAGRFLLLCACAGLCVSLPAANQEPAAELPAADPAVKPPAAAGRPVSPQPQAPAATADPPALPIQDAVEGIVDEDEPTRRAAENRLAAATEADLPVLEKYADSSDPEIRRQVRLLLKKLKRGTFAFTASFPDHTAAAGVKFTVKLYTAEAAGNPSGENTQGQILLVNRGRMGMANELASLDCVADAAGRVQVGRYNDGDYLYVVEPQDPLPPQPINGKLTMTADVQPLQFEVKRGVTVTVTVTDTDGQPLPEVTVYNAEDGNFLNQVLRQNPAQTRMMLGRSTNATTDEKGVAVLEKVGLKEINIVATRESYDCAYRQNVEAKDGAAVSVSLKMIKTVPYKCTLQLRPLQGKLPAGLRLLAMKQLEMQKILGRQWNLNLAYKSIDEYVKNGAIDLGVPSDDAEIKAELLPDGYFVVGLLKDDSRIFFSNFSVMVKDGTIQVPLREMPKPSR